MTLHYLEFDRSEDSEGVTTFEAMASVRADRWPAVMDEASRVLRWLHQHHPGGPGALEDGAEWDVWLEVREEPDRPWPAAFNPSIGRLEVQAAMSGEGYFTLTLTLCGGLAWADSFADAGWTAESEGQ